MANKQGERKKCSECGGEAIVTHPGDGNLTCCGKEMEKA
jgi:desulfoferrodoxin-like iron-binding protein